MALSKISISLPADLNQQVVEVAKRSRDTVSHFYKTAAIAFLERNGTPYQPQTETKPARRSRRKARVTKVVA